MDSSISPPKRLRSDRAWQMIFIAVGTPPDEDGSADLKYVLEVAKPLATSRSLCRHRQQIDGAGRHGRSRARGRASELSELRGMRHVGIRCGVQSRIPERRRAVEDCLRPDRIIVGSSSERAVAVLRKLYAPFNRNHDRMVVMDERSAELTKYAANAMLATKISFMNEIANIAERVGADVELVRQGIGSDPRIGYHFIYPGAGYGGSCFPKDVQALERTARSVGYDARLLRRGRSGEPAAEDQTVRVDLAPLRR
jgi:UDPglucose 6-dehydrogenase